jgi:mannose/fructose/N-acetylgalactosamine-specific phosphotransferase system component IID
MKDTEKLHHNKLYPSFKKFYVKQKYNKKEICPYLKFGNSQQNTKVMCYQVVEAILYKLENRLPIETTSHEAVF